jgi:putative ATP-binding cassette transporter
MDEATSALDEAGQENVMKLLIDELPETSIVSIGHRPGLEAFHTRELTLEPGKEGATLRAKRQKRRIRDVYRRLSRASRASGKPPRR